MAKAGETDVLLGEDWVAPDAASDLEIREQREKRGLLSLNSSPLARKIITFNLMALIVLVAGVLYLNPGRDGMVRQYEEAFVSQGELLASVAATRLSRPTLPAPGPLAETLEQTLPFLGPSPEATVFDGLKLDDAVELALFNPALEVVATAQGSAESGGPAAGAHEPALLTDFLNSAWGSLERLFPSGAGVSAPVDDKTIGLVRQALAEKATKVQNFSGGEGPTNFIVATPVVAGDQVLGVLSLTSASSAIDARVRAEREQVLQMFVIAILVSVGLSLVLASTIANPLSDLAAAAEIGRDKNARKLSPSRVRIPDLTARPDEIGRLSGALRGMVSALYERIAANEQFAADVAHEIKNPLASLRSAVGTLHVTNRDDHREKLLRVIEHDVRRLDRLVSDISNASRLDSELVKEEEEVFSLRQLLENLTQHLGQEAREKGIDFISDLPSEPITIHGLEARLAQVFVNLITNAISFCDDGDAVRVWARKRANRVLVVVEDTGPGIPEQALTKIFKRFYSERPVGQFGDHSGLGLAISKQIVEAHGGVIWAENIRPTDADVTSEPLGARFVVGLPL